MARSALITMAIALASATAADAGTFQISPTRLELGERGSSQIIELRNTGVDPVRMQITASAWDQSAAGDIELSKTQDLVVFPTLFTLAPKETRRVKIGITIPPGARERSYRVIVEELPSPTAQLVTGLRVLTRMSVPVFQSPVKAVRAGGITRAVLVGTRLTLEARNRGSVSLMLKTAKVVCKDTSGLELWSGSADGWYLLAGGTRAFTLEVPSELAPRIFSMHVEISTDRDTWRRAFTVGED